MTLVAIAGVLKTPDLPLKALQLTLNRTELATLGKQGIQLLFSHPNGVKAYRFLQHRVYDLGSSRSVWIVAWLLVLDGRWRTGLHSPQLGKPLADPTGSQRLLAAQALSRFRNGIGGVEEQNENIRR